MHARRLGGLACGPVRGEAPGLGPGHTPEVCPLLWAGCQLTSGALRMGPGVGVAEHQGHPPCAAGDGETRAQGRLGAGASCGVIIAGIALFFLSNVIFKRVIFLILNFFFTNRNTSLFNFYFYFMSLFCHFFPF